MVVLSTNQVVSASTDKTIRVWDPNTGECLRKLTGHTADVRALVRLPGDKIASASYDKSVRIWDVETGACIKELAGHTGVRMLAAFVYYF